MLRCTFMIYYNCKYLMIIENYITIKKRNTCTVYSTRHRRMGPRGGGGWVVWGRRFWHSWRYVHQKQTAVLFTPAPWYELHLCFYGHWEEGGIAKLLWSSPKPHAPGSASYPGARGKCAAKSAFSWNDT